MNLATIYVLKWSFGHILLQKSQDLLRELRMKKSDVEMKTGLIDDGLPAVMELVEEAKQHADDLKKQAEGLAQ